jgi:hypothetical protein
LLALAFKWDWEKIDACPMAIVTEYVQFLESHPPADYLVAAYFGVKPKRKPRVDRSGNVMLPFEMNEAITPGVLPKEKLPEGVRKWLATLKKK